MRSRIEDITVFGAALVDIWGLALIVAGYMGIPITDWNSWQGYYFWLFTIVSLIQGGGLFIIGTGIFVKEKIENAKWHR